MGKRRLRPDSAKIVTCSRVSRKVTQFPFHRTFPALAAEEEEGEASM